MNYYKEILEQGLAGNRLSWELLAQVPEFKACIGSPEHSKWHPEGTTERHMDLVWDVLFNKYNWLAAEDFNLLNVAILFHDWMKPSCLSIGKDGMHHAYNHEFVGSRYLLDFAYKAYCSSDGEHSLNNEQLKLFLTLSRLVLWHMSKDIAFWSTRRGNLCLSGLTEREIHLLNILQDCDYNGSLCTTKALRDVDVCLAEMRKVKSGIVNYQPNNDQSFTMLIGASGSKKSTFANSLKTEDNYIISTDDIRMKLLGSEENQSHGDKIFDTAKSRLGLLLNENNNVILDCTNLTFKSRRQFLEIAHKYKVNCSAYVFLAPLEECIHNQFLRKRQVPSSIVRNQYNKMELPSYLEFNAIHYVN